MKKLVITIVLIMSMLVAVSGVSAMDLRPNVIITVTLKLQDSNGNGIEGGYFRASLNYSLLMGPTGADGVYTGNVNIPYGFCDFYCYYNATETSTRVFVTSANITLTFKTKKYNIKLVDSNGNELTPQGLYGYHYWDFMQNVGRPGWYPINPNGEMMTSGGSLNKTISCIYNDSFTFITYIQEPTNSVIFKTRTVNVRILNDINVQVTPDVIMMKKCVYNNTWKRMEYGEWKTVSATFDVVSYKVIIQTPPWGIQGTAVWIKVEKTNQLAGASKYVPNGTGNYDVDFFWRKLTIWTAANLSFQGASGTIDFTKPSMEVLIGDAIIIKASDDMGYTKDFLYSTSSIFKEFTVAFIVFDAWCKFEAFYNDTWHDVSSQFPIVLIPGKYNTIKFKATYNGISCEKSEQFITNKCYIEFKLIVANISVKDTLGNPVSEDFTLVYKDKPSSQWSEMPIPFNTSTSEYILESIVDFKLSTPEGISTIMRQDIAIKQDVTFVAVDTKVELRDSSNKYITESVSFHCSNGNPSATLRDLGTTANGYIDTKMILADGVLFGVSFRGNDATETVNIKQGKVVKFQTGKIVSATGTGNCVSYSINGADFPFVDGIELLPGNYTFKFSDGTPDFPGTVVAGQTLTLP